jgi:hypothetical protein
MEVLWRFSYNIKKKLRKKIINDKSRSDKQGNHIKNKEI